MSLDANELYHKLITAGSDWADKQAAAGVLEDTKSAVLCRLMIKSNAPSVAAREVEAKASQEYQDHVRATQEAVKAALKAKVQYEAIRTWIDLKRTESANTRAEMRLS